MSDSTRNPRITPPTPACQRRPPLRATLFIDRDGTVNRHVGYVTKPEQLELLPGAGAAIRRLNQAGVLAVLITNQAVVARGECTFADLERIHARLETLLGEEGAYLDGIFACPHHPGDGMRGRVAELTIRCNCRKPQPGLVYQAVQELPVDLNRSAVVGDTERDVGLARRLGLPAYRISPALLSEPGVTSVLDLAEAVERWLEYGLAVPTPARCP
jgi:histidinol-phosphate phosphatase family protein